MLILNNEDASKVLDMRLCLSALDQVFQELAGGDAVEMGRTDLYVPSNLEKAPYDLRVGPVTIPFWRQYAANHSICSYDSLSRIHLAATDDGVVTGGNRL